jgi:hypothetical protein
MEIIRDYGYLFEGSLVVFDRALVMRCYSKNIITKEGCYNLIKEMSQ